MEMPMSGNRKKQKNGLFVAGALLLTSLCSYGLEKQQIDTFENLTKDFDAWGQKLSNPTATKAALLSELRTIIDELSVLVSTIPDTPPADCLIKTMIQDIIDCLDAVHATLPKVKSLIDLKKAAGTDTCSLQPMLDKAKKDLAILIGHIEAHPDIYSAEVLQALKKYNATTFTKVYNYWRPKGVAEWLAIFTRWITRK
jgi:hypothetical protein